MKIALLQTDIAWNDPQANFTKACGLLASGREGDLDLVLLPEMFTTGFAVEPAGIAESDGKALQWMRAVARSTDAAVAGSVAIEQEGPGGKRYLNRMFFVKPDGSATSYDKRHLFSFAGEQKRYTAGTERVVVEWRGWRILLQVCYDLRFPVFARQRRVGGDYDMILYCANWPTARLDAWHALLKARAIENLCYVAAVNRTGDDPFAGYSGGSCLIDHKGRVVAAADEGREMALVAEADLEALRAFRRKFPALDDADRFSLE